MDQFAAVLEFIGENESLFSGIAALIAILGVCGALVVRLSKTLRKEGVEDRAAVPALSAELHQEISYTRNSEGHSLAYSIVGEGYPLVRSLGWFTNLDHEWGHPGSRACIETMARHHRYLRYDARGIGMSQRDVGDVSAETRLADLEAVMDAAEIERCILMGLSEGGTTAIQYAARHPERVSHLVLWGTFLSTAMDEKFVQQWSALFDLLPHQWGGDNPGFHQLFTSMFLPDGDAEQNRFFNEMQKHSASADVVEQTLLSISQVDVTDVAAGLQVPTLVLHRVNDLVVPCAQGKEIAATIPGARLVQLSGSNHWIHCDVQAYEQMVREIEMFVAATGTG